MLGDLDRGEMLTGELAATQLARADVVLRSRALLSGARKDLDSAAAEAEEAVDAPSSSSRRPAPRFGGIAPPPSFDEPDCGKPSLEP